MHWMWTLSYLVCSEPPAAYPQKSEGHLESRQYGRQRPRYRRNLLIEFPAPAKRLVQGNVLDDDGKAGDRILLFKLIFLPRGVQHIQEIRYPVFIAPGVKIQSAPACFNGLGEMLGGFKLRPVSHEGRVHLFHSSDDRLAIVGKKFS